MVINLAGAEENLFQVGSSSDDLAIINKGPFSYVVKLAYKPEILYIFYYCEREIQPFFSPLLLPLSLHFDKYCVTGIMLRPVYTD